MLFFFFTFTYLYVIIERDSNVVYTHERFKSSTNLFNNAIILQEYTRVIRKSYAERG